MFFIALGIHESPLMNMGDAVASFLECKDPATDNMCLASIKYIQKQSFRAGARQWEDKKYRWKDVTSKTRRLVTLFMYEHIHPVPMAIDNADHRV